MRKALVFSNYLSFKMAMFRLPLGEEVYIQFIDEPLIGLSVVEYLADFTLHYQESGGKVMVEGMQ